MKRSPWPELQVAVMSAMCEIPGPKSGVVFGDSLGIHAAINAAISRIVAEHGWTVAEWREYRATKQQRAKYDRLWARAEVVHKVLNA